MADTTTVDSTASWTLQVTGSGTSTDVILTAHGEAFEWARASSSPTVSDGGHIVKHLDTTGIELKNGEKVWTRRLIQQSSSKITVTVT